MYLQAPTQSQSLEKLGEDKKEPSRCEINESKIWPRACNGKMTRRSPATGELQVLPKPLAEINDAAASESSAANAEKYWMAATGEQE